MIKPIYNHKRAFKKKTASKSYFTTHIDSFTFFRTFFDRSMSRTSRCNRNHSFAFFHSSNLRRRNAENTIRRQSGNHFIRLVSIREDIFPDKMARYVSVLVFFFFVLSFDDDLATDSFNGDFVWSELLHVQADLELVFIDGYFRAGIISWGRPR